MGGGWSALAGSADGQVLSFGPLQWNLGQGTLVPVLRRIKALDGIGFNLAIGMEISDLLPDPKALTGFVKATVLDRDGHPRPSWRARFATLAGLAAAETAFLESAAGYLSQGKALAELCELQTERGLALCFDVAVQNGAPRSVHVREYRKRIPGLRMEYERLKVLAHVVANEANPTWKADVLSRKLAIANGTGKVHGAPVDLSRSFGIEYHRRWYEPTAGEKGDA